MPAPSDDFGTATRRKPDQYAEIIRAMQPGLLVTVNKSGGANAVGSDELRVVKRTSEEEIVLEGHADYEYLLRPETDDGPILERISGGLGRNGTRPVETIEVIGIDDR